MKTAFIRADASLAIGTGHVMRCLVLADALKGRGTDVHFLCRAHEGHLADLIADRGFAVHLLPLGSDGYADLSDAPPHAAWLGALPEEDSAACRDIITAAGGADLLVVDHYALDHSFETPLRAVTDRILVIDDLADRPHDCDVLVDQNIDAALARYKDLLPVSCTPLLGPHYALLRPEFAALRVASLTRRNQGKVRSVLVSMGGVDIENATGAVLEALRSAGLPGDLKVTVVMGATAPWRKQVIAQATTMPFETRVLVDVRNMAHLMYEADLAVGAAGSTTWERCCLGLPTLQMVLADNQCAIAQAISDAGAAVLVERGDLTEGIRQFMATIEHNPICLTSMARAAAAITDGHGTERVAHQLWKGQTT